MNKNVKKTKKDFEVIKESKVTELPDGRILVTVFEVDEFSTKKQKAN